MMDGRILLARKIEHCDDKSLNCVVLVGGTGQRTPA